MPLEGPEAVAPNSARGWDHGRNPCVGTLYARSSRGPGTGLRTRREFRRRRVPSCTVGPRDPRVDCCRQPARPPGLRADRRGPQVVRRPEAAVQYWRRAARRRQGACVRQPPRRAGTGDRLLPSRHLRGYCHARVRCTNQRPGGLIGPGCWRPPVAVSGPKAPARRDDGEATRSSCSARGTSPPIPTAAAMSRRSRSRPEKWCPLRLQQMPARGGRTSSRASGC